MRKGSPCTGSVSNMMSPSRGALRRRSRRSGAERRRLARDLHDGVLQDLSYTTAAMGIIQLNVEGTSLEEELQAIDAIRRAAQGLRAAVNDLRIEDERDRPFPDLVESLVERNRGMARSYEIILKVEEGFPRHPLGMLARRYCACSKRR